MEFIFVKLKGTPDFNWNPIEIIDFNGFSIKIKKIQGFGLSLRRGRLPMLKIIGPCQLEVAQNASPAGQPQQLANEEK